MKHLKLFKTEADYQVFVESDSFVTPNVSFAEEENLVFYNPYEEKINYVACFEEFYSIPSGIEVTIEDKEKHIVGERLDPYGNFRGYMIGVPENGLNITIHNNSDRQFYGGLTNEFNDGPFYELAPNAEVIVQLYINSYGNVYAKGPDGRVGDFAGGNERETSVGLLPEYYIYFDASEV